MSLIYLASPYSHADPKVREERYEKAVEANANLIERGHLVYSPIVHGHPLNKYWKEHEEARMGWEFWARFDTLMIKKADQFWILTLDGWKESVGVTNEFHLATQLYMPIWFVRDKSYIITGEI